MARRAISDKWYWKVSSPPMPGSVLPNNRRSSATHWKIIRQRFTRTFCGLVNAQGDPTMATLAEAHMLFTANDRLRMLSRALHWSSLLTTTGREPPSRDIWRGGALAQSPRPQGVDAGREGDGYLDRRGRADERRPMRDCGGLY